MDKGHTCVCVSEFVSWHLRLTEKQRTRMTTWTTWWETCSHAISWENLPLITLSLLPVSVPHTPTRTPTSWAPLACWQAASSDSPPWSALAATTAAFFAMCQWAWSWSSFCCTTWCPGSRADRRRVGLWFSPAQEDTILNKQKVGGCGCFQRGSDTQHRGVWLANKLALTEVLPPSTSRSKPLPPDTHPLRFSTVVESF